MSLPLGPKDDLRRMADAAREQGRVKLASTCLLALSYIEQLEAELALIQANKRKAGYARADALTPERRREIAIQAGRRLKAATGTDPLF